MMFLRITIRAEQERNQAFCKARESLSEPLKEWRLDHRAYPVFQYGGQYQF